MNAEQQLAEMRDTALTYARANRIERLRHAIVDAVPAAALARLNIDALMIAIGDDDEFLHRCETAGCDFTGPHIHVEITDSAARITDPSPTNPPKVSL